MPAIACVDGAITDLADARIPLDDRGFLVGEGIFETLRTIEGTLFAAEAHRRRFEQGAIALGIPGAMDDYDVVLASLVAEGQRRFGGALRLRIQASTGPMRDIAGAAPEPRVTGICRPFEPYPGPGDGGLRLRTSRHRIARGPFSGLKTLSFLPYVAARREAQAAGVDDALLLNDLGAPTEASTSNLFARLGDTVHAPGPEEGAVAGVTRDIVLELLQARGIPVRTALGTEALAAADEVWLTNTTGGVLAVTAIDDQTYPVGALGRDLRAGLEERMGL